MHEAASGGSRSNGLIADEPVLTVEAENPELFDIETGYTGPEMLYDPLRGIEGFGAGGFIPSTYNALGEFHNR